MDTPAFVSLTAACPRCRALVFMGTPRVPGRHTFPCWRCDSAVLTLDVADDGTFTAYQQSGQRVDLHPQASPFHLDFTAPAAE